MKKLSVLKNDLFFCCFFALLFHCRICFSVDSNVSHKVQNGETLWEIAQKYNVSVSNIVELNNITNLNRISKDQVLIIPIKGTAPLENLPAAKTEKPAKTKKKSNVSPVITEMISKNGTHHKVRKGETLWEISKKYNVAIGSIISANGLGSPNNIKVGDKLFIPVEKDNTAKTENRSENYDLVKRQVKDLIALPIYVRPRRWQYILIHHSATDSGNAKLFDYHHKYKRHMSNGLAYHFVINNGNKGADGKIEVGDRWKRQIHGGHVKSDFFNEVGIGICLVGNFEKYPPSAAQFQSTLSLVRALQQKFRIPSKRVLGHRDVNGRHTLCPGKYFPLMKLKNLLAD